MHQIPIGWVKRFPPHQCGPLAASTLEEEDAGATSLQARCIVPLGVLATAPTGL